MGDAHQRIRGNLDELRERLEPLLDEEQRQRLEAAAERFRRGPGFGPPGSGFGPRGPRPGSTGRQGRRHGGPGDSAWGPPDSAWRPADSADAPRTP
jgi:hypothetical protein